MINVPREVIPIAVGFVIAVFAFGYAIGHAIGKRDGEQVVSDYYNGRRRWE